VVSQAKSPVDPYRSNEKTMKNRRKKQKELIPLSTVLPNLLKSIRTGSDAQLVEVWELWDGLVGEAIAKNTRPAAFKGKLLLVEVSSSTWMHQLQFLKADIVEKINDAFGKEMVEEIKFKIGTV
jgi:predicted nucleic acid-binding Zn ribbon protein